MMMKADGRVLSPSPVATNDGGRSDQFVLGALATELNQKAGPQDKHFTMLGRLRLDAARIQSHFYINTNIETGNQINNEK